MSFINEFFYFCANCISLFLKTPYTVVIGMGSNLGDREKLLNDALKEMKKLGKNFKMSSIWEADPWDSFSTETFLNAVVIFKTTLSPYILLRELQKIEDFLGRKRTPGLKWENRNIDLDILFYGEKIIETTDFHVPHKYLHHRAFVLIPLAELSPNFNVFHLQKKVKDIVQSLPKTDIQSVRLFSSFSV